MTDTGNGQIACAEGAHTTTVRCESLRHPHHRREFLQAEQTNGKTANASPQLQQRLSEDRSPGCRTVSNGISRSTILSTSSCPRGMPIMTVLEHREFVTYNRCQRPLWPGSSRGTPWQLATDGTQHRTQRLNRPSQLSHIPSDTHETCSAAVSFDKKLCRTR